MRVAPGETVALVGMSGSGKSTVSLLLPRFYDAQDGTITIDGVDIRDVTLDSLRREVGVVFEDAFLFSDSVRNNIAYGRPDATDDDVRRAADVAGASVFIEALPDGYDTVVGERGLTLSGGQRQRIAIARAVLTDPRVLVLDDATSSIDARTEEQIHATLREIMEHRTTILIAHRRSTLRLAERIIVMENGHAVEDGTHEELMATSARYRTLLTGPGDDAEADAIEELVAAGGVTPDLWRRDETNGQGNGVRRLRLRRPGPRDSVMGAGAGAAAVVAAPGRAGRAARSPPSSWPRSTRSRRPTTSPTSTSRAEANKHETFRLRRFVRPYRKQVLIGFAAHRGRHDRHPRRTAARAARAAERRAPGFGEGAVHLVGVLLPHRHRRLAAHLDLHRATRAAPRSDCSTRCASGSSRICSGSRSTTTTARWRVAS